MTLNHPLEDKGVVDELTCGVGLSTSVCASLGVTKQKRKSNLKCLHSYLIRIFHVRSCPRFLDFITVYSSFVVLRSFNLDYQDFIYKEESDKMDITLRAFSIPVLFFCCTDVSVKRNFDRREGESLFVNLYDS